MPSIEDIIKGIVNKEVQAATAALEKKLAEILAAVRQDSGGDSAKAATKGDTPENEESASTGEISADTATEEKPKRRGRPKAKAPAKKAEAKKAPAKKAPAKKAAGPTTEDLVAKAREFMQAGIKANDLDERRAFLTDINKKFGVALVRELSDPDDVKEAIAMIEAYGTDSSEPKIDDDDDLI